jgi:hypothetical protein
MEYLFLFYIFSSIILISGGGFFLFNSGKVILGGIYLLATLTAAILFGFRWFLPTGEFNKDQVTTWPPVLNSCPDFLTLYNLAGKPVCIDTQGTSMPGGMARWTDPNQTAEQFIFNLYTDMTGEARAKKLCEECGRKKVTWEGVFDGATCMNVNPPIPQAPQGLTSRGPAPAPGGA